MISPIWLYAIIATWDVPLTTMLFSVRFVELIRVHKFSLAHLRYHEGLQDILKNFEVFYGMLEGTFQLKTLLKNLCLFHMVLNITSASLV